MERLIILEGNIIDVTKIHFIEPIVKHYMDLYGKVGEKYNKIPKEYSFKINFYGKESITIRKNCHTEFNPEKTGIVNEKYFSIPYWYELPDGEEKSNSILKRVETARDTLVKFWNESRTNIPIIEV